MPDQKDDTTLDGNAEMVRVIADQIGNTIVARMEQSNKLVDFHTNRQFHEWLDERMDNRNRKVLFQLLAAYLIPVLVGGAVIYNKLDTAIQDQAENTDTLYARAQFIRDQQEFNCRVLQHLARKDGTEVIRELGPCRFQSADDMRDLRR